MGIKYSKQAIEEAKEMARWDRPLAPGVYPAQIIDAVIHEGPKGECGKYTLLIDAPGTAAPEGPVKLDHFVATLASVKQFLKIFDPAKLSGGDDEMDVEPEDYLDGSCRVLVIQEEYEGKMRPKIGNLLPLEENMPQPRSHSGAVGKPAPKPAEKPKEKAPANASTSKAPAADDETDLPF